MNLTIDDVLKLVWDRAQWCRENGESDMRSIIYLVDSIRNDIKANKSREEILADCEEEDEDEDW